jgi:archaellum component FlaC
MKSSKLPTSLVPLPSGNDGQSRLDHIYKQIKELQQFKDEIMDDLDEFMDDVETKSLITIPE